MRKEITVTLQDRGESRTFKIREMSATQLESWGVRALLLLSAAIDIKGLEVGNGMDFDVLNKLSSYLFVNGIERLSHIDYDKAQPLLDELLECCYRVDGGVEQKCTRNTVDGYISDIRTLLRLRGEALKLNFSFLADGASLESPDSNQTLSIPRPKS